MTFNKNIQRAFLALVLVQGMHSTEEYAGRLWESFPPARALCSLVSDNLETGFLVINIGLFLLGILCWAFPVRNGWQIGLPLIWFWVVIECINGIGHPVWTLMQGGYTPGVATAPLLFLIALYLIRKLN